MINDYPIYEELLESSKLKNKDFPLQLGRCHFYCKEALMEDINAYKQSAYKPGETVRLYKDYETRVNYGTNIILSKGLLIQLLFGHFNNPPYWIVKIPITKDMSITTTIAEDLIVKNR